MFSNWKMAVCDKRIYDLSLCAKSFSAKFPPNSQLTLFPSFEHLSMVQALCDGTNVALGAQDVSEQSVGSFTGQVSAQSVAKVGAQYALCGHVESRALWPDNVVIDRVFRKIERCWESGICPVVCCEQGDLGRGGLLERVAQAHKKVIVAYEEGVCVGSGQASSMDDINQAVSDIRSKIAPDRLSGVIYGGSVNAMNVTQLMESDIGGVLVGGASHNEDSYSALLEKILLNL